jgi:hypothetical protein
LSAAAQAKTRLRQSIKATITVAFIPIQAWVSQLATLWLQSVIQNFLFARDPCASPIIFFGKTVMVTIATL